MVKVILAFMCLSLTGGILAEPPAMAALEGKKLMVRVYRDWRKDPAIYKLVPAEIHSFQLTTRPADMAPSAILAVWGADQVSPEITKALEGVLWIRKIESKDGAKVDPAGMFSFPGSAERRTRENGERFIMDARGEPIENATVTLTYSAGDDEGAPRIVLKDLKTGLVGKTCLPQSHGEFRSMVCRIQHPNYGIAEIRRRIYWEPGTKLHLPLIQDGIPAAERALRGVVVTPEGQPLAGVAIACGSVRTLGEGLINASNESAQVITGNDGRFRLYIPYADTRKEFGDLIPPKSRYHINVSVPGKPEFLSHSEAVYNDSEARITLVRGTHYHTFQFVDGADATIDPIPQGYEPFCLTLRLPDGKRMVAFERDFIRTGGRIPLGKLEVSQHDKTAWKFQPMEITAASPQDLVFVAETSKTYTGRVVHGVTGLGMPGVLVFAYNRSTDTNIADLTPEQWRALHGLPPAPALEEPALQVLKGMYGLNYAVRTGPDGVFRLAPPPAMHYYGFMAIEESYLGYLRRTDDLKPDEQGNVPIPDIPLFPAARMLVKIRGNNKDHYISYWPRWILDKENAPAWTANLLQQDKSGPWGWCETGHLKTGEREVFLMPAGVKYQIDLCGVRFDRVFEPQQGETIDLGEVSPKDKEAWAALVRVVGPDGAPLEGIPVRRGSKGPAGKIQIYSESHNADGNGVVQFYVEPGTEGAFSVIDFPGESYARLKAEVPYRIPPNPTEIPVFTIRLTQEQVDALLGKASGPAVATPSL